MKKKKKKKKTTQPEQPCGIALQPKIVVEYYKI